MDEQQVFEFPATDSPLVGKVKGDRNTMVYNFFSLRREKETELPRYDDGETWIEVVGTKHGVASIWDKELLVYSASLIADKINRGESPVPRISFTAHDFFVTTGSATGGSAYERLEESLARLKSTFVRTNIETGGEGEDRGFGWLDEYRILYRRGRDGSKQMRAVELTLCAWLFRAIVQDKHFLTYSPKYFELPPVAKRLYEIARSGPPSGFRMNLTKLRARVGTAQDLRRFKAEISAYSMHKRSLPDYGIALIDPRIRRSIDKGFPNPSGNAPLKSWLVAFYPTSNITSLEPLETMPLLEDDEAELTAA
ncbi:replication initiator protein A [Teichococcus vastitatis]|jgi:plasmid replication initiation protein|uniref:Replication initiator protein A n=1 Tax=Teichococcus vastitatis TaxID=2307076 RepID=A0ABS9W688_9PROT|nr:replication initiator protein A [Pseudoroseomonas vastitatis]MCI0754806.1 replication initiator protein A [Pseudoroseomonas vastitatis]